MKNETSFIIREGLNKRKIYWRKALNNISEGIFIADAKYTIVGCNETLCRLLKKKKEDIIDKKCYELIHGKDRRIKQCLLFKARKQGRQKRVAPW